MKFLTTDGVNYRLDSLGRYGDASARLAVESNRGTSLSDWIEKMVAVLQPCWRDRPNAP